MRVELDNIGIIKNSTMERKNPMKAVSTGNIQDNGIPLKVIDEIRQIAIRYDVQKVILFGSRARGDYKRTSDIDLAVSGGNCTGFILAVEEETNTLLKYDIINLDGPVQEKLLESIEREGKLIYEKI